MLIEWQTWMILISVDTPSLAAAVGAQRHTVVVAVAGGALPLATARRLVAVAIHQATARILHSKHMHLRMGMATLRRMRTLRRLRRQRIRTPRTGTQAATPRRLRSTRLSLLTACLPPLLILVRFRH